MLLLGCSCYIEKNTQSDCLNACAKSGTTVNLIGNVHHSWQIQVKKTELKQKHKFQFCKRMQCLSQVMQLCPRLNPNPSSREKTSHKLRDQKCFFLSPKNSFIINIHAIKGVTHLGCALSDNVSLSLYRTRHYPCSVVSPSLFLFLVYIPLTTTTFKSMLFLQQLGPVTC